MVEGIIPSLNNWARMKERKHDKNNAFKKQGRNVRKILLFKTMKLNYIINENKKPLTVIISKTDTAAVLLPDGLYLIFAVYRTISLHVGWVV